MPRLTADQWETIRAEREAGESFDKLAQAHGVTKAAIIKQAKKHNWSDGTDVGAAVRRKVTEMVTGVVTGGNPEKKAQAIEKAAAKVVAVVASHQKEWHDHRERFGVPKTSAEVEVKESFEDAKLAKITAEMLMIRQKGERAAHGLEDGETGQSREQDRKPLVLQISGREVDVKALGWV